MINLQTFASENLSFQNDYAILHDGMVIKVHFSIIVLLLKKNELIVKFVTFDNRFEIFVHKSYIFT